MAGFMAGFGQGFAKAFEAQTQRLEERDAAEKARAFQERMAQVQRDWELKMAERNEAFQEKWKKEQRRWDLSDKATEQLAQMERDRVSRNQSLFDQGLARSWAISDYKRGRADKKADLEEERKYNRIVTQEERNYQKSVADKAWAREKVDETIRYNRTRKDQLDDLASSRTYDATESDRRATRDSGIRDKEANSSLGREKDLASFRDSLLDNREEREKKKLEDKKQRDAVAAATLFAEEMGVPASKRKSAVDYLAQRILLVGLETVEKQVSSGDFKLTGIEEKTAPTNANQRSDQEMQRLQRESGMPTGMDILTPEEAQAKGIQANPEQPIVFRRVEDDKLPDLQDLIYRRSQAQAAGNFADVAKYSSQIRAVTAAQAIKSNAKAVENGMTPVTVYSKEDGYVSGYILNDPETGAVKLYSVDQKTQIDMTGKSLVSDAELELGQKIAKDMTGPVSDYQTRLGSFAQTTAYVGQAYRIAEADPRVRTLAGTIAQKATGLVRDIASASDLVLNELRNTGKLSPEIESQALDLEKKMQELLTKDTLSLAENTALFKAFVTMSAFRAAALFDQKGRALSIPEYNAFYEVNMGGGRPEVLRQTYQGIYGIIANDLNVSRSNLLNNPQLSNFRKVYKRDIPGLEIESVEDTFEKYGEDAKYGYDLVTGNQTSQPQPLKSNQPLQFNSETELQEAIKQGRLVEGDIFLGPNGERIKFQPSMQKGN